MWYVIQTVTGKEQELMKAIENVLVGNKREETYKRCFTLERECIWRIEGQFRIHIEPLFPSYVFAETDNPDAFFIALKQVPKLAKLLGAEGNFWSIGACIRGQQGRAVYRSAVPGSCGCKRTDRFGRRSTERLLESDCKTKT